MARLWLCSLMIFGFQFYLSNCAIEFVGNFDATSCPDLHHLVGFLDLEEKKLDGCMLPISSENYWGFDKDSCHKPEEVPEESIEIKRAKIDDGYRDYWAGRMSMGLRIWKSRKEYIEMMLKKEDLLEKLATGFDLESLYNKIDTLGRQFPDRYILVQLKRILDYYLNYCPCEDPKIIYSKMIGVGQLITLLLYDVADAPCEEDKKLPFCMDAVEKMKTYYDAVLLFAGSSQKIIGKECQNLKLEVEDAANQTTDASFRSFYSQLEAPVPDFLESIEQKLLNSSIESLSELYQDVLKYSKQSGFLPEVTRYLIEQVYAPVEFAATNFFNESIPHNVKLYLLCSYSVRFLMPVEWNYKHLDRLYQSVVAPSLLGILFQRIKQENGINPLKSLADAVGVERIGEAVLAGTFDGGCKLTEGGLHLDFALGYMLRRHSKTTSLSREVYKFSKSEMKKFMENYGIPEVLKFEQQMKTILEMGLDTPPLEIPNKY